MKENVKEANVVMARCKISHKTYGIRIEKRTDNVWYCTWAFPLSEKVGENEGYGKNMISGKVVMDKEYPGCPYCGNMGWVSFGNCSKLTCYDGNETRFICEWCKSSGKLQVAENFELNAGGY